MAQIVYGPEMPSIWSAIRDYQDLHSKAQAEQDKQDALNRELAIRANADILSKLRPEDQARFMAAQPGVYGDMNGFVPSQDWQQTLKDQIAQAQIGDIQGVQQQPGAPQGAPQAPPQASQGPVNFDQAFMAPPQAQAAQQGPPPPTIPPQGRTAQSGDMLSTVGGPTPSPLTAMPTRGPQGAPGDVMPPGNQPAQNGGVANQIAAEQRRALAVYGAAGANLFDAIQNSHLSPEQQQYAIEIATKVSPDAATKFVQENENQRTVYAQQNENQRAQLQAQTSRRGQDLSFAGTMAEVKSRADLQQKQFDHEVNMSMTGDPDAVNRAVDAVVANPEAHSILAKGAKGKAGQAFVAAVDQELIRRYGTLPGDPTTDQRGRFTSVNVGEATLDTMKTISDKWAKAGVPLNGAIIGRYNEKSRKIGLSVPEADLVMSGNPNWNRLSSKQKAEYIADASQFAYHGMILSAQETKAQVGGRPAYQMFEAIKSVTPNMTMSTPALDGAFNAAKSQFDLSREGIRAELWGGNAPPKPGTSGANGGASAGVGAAGPKIGEEKTFPNGKRGRFDGHGWVEVK